MVLYIYIIKSYETTTKGCFLGGDGIEIETSRLFFFFFFFFWFFVCAVVGRLCQEAAATQGLRESLRIETECEQRLICTAPCSSN